MIARLVAFAAVALAVGPAAFAQPADGRGGGNDYAGDNHYAAKAPVHTVRPPLYWDPAPVAPRIAPPPAGKAQVVFYRATTMIDPTPTVTVQANGAPVAQLAPGAFEVVAAEPGQQVFSVGAKGRAVRLVLQPGETYFVRQTARLFSAGPHIEVSSEAEFRALAPRPAGSDD